MRRPRRRRDTTLISLLRLPQWKPPRMSADGFLISEDQSIDNTRVGSVPDSIEQRLQIKRLVCLPGCAAPSDLRRRLFSAATGRRSSVWQHLGVFREMAI